MVDKERIKSIIMEKIHSVPKYHRDVLEQIIGQGLYNYFSFKYETFRDSILRYTNSLCVDKYEYKYAMSSKASCLYASIYACMIYGLTGELSRKSLEYRKGWKEYFDSFQSKKDGLFYPPELLGDSYEGKTDWGDGWGKRHLAGHIIIAYSRLGFTPKYKITYYDFLFDENERNKWKDSFKFKTNIWSESNYIMNAYTILQYNRDNYGDAKAGVVVEDIKTWLLSKQNTKTGLWHEGDLDNTEKIEDAIRGSYHFFPLFAYDKEKIFGVKKSIDYILSSQNSWGGFASERTVAGACEDIDAIDPLIRLSIANNYRIDEVRLALRKSLIWVLSNFNSDGGATFYMQNGHHYGGHELTKSAVSESNLFSTWFRTLCLSYMLEYLDIENGFTIGNFPGYEIELEKTNEK